MKNNLHISEGSVADTQLEDKGLNNDLYNYRGGFPNIEKIAAFCMYPYRKPQE